MPISAVAVIQLVLRVQALYLFPSTLASTLVLSFVNIPTEYLSNVFASSSISSIQMNISSLIGAITRILLIYGKVRYLPL